MKFVRIVLPRVLCMMLAMMTATMPLKLFPVYAASAQYTYSDAPTLVKPTGGDIGISGENMVFYDDDATGHSQIYVTNLSKGVSRALTDSPNVKQAPAIGGRLVTWTEMEPGAGWTVMCYDLEKNESKKISPAPGTWVLPSTDGRFVVWHSPAYSGDMHLYDSITGTEKAIGQGRDPQAAKGKVLFHTSGDGGLGLYDPATDATVKIITLPNGQYASWFAFNGDYALWQQSNGKVTKYVTINVNKLSQGPRDLTPAVQQKVPHIEIAIGDSFAAWIQDDNGLPAIKGVYLDKGETFELAAGSANNMLYGISGNYAFVKNSEGMLTYREITRTESGGFSSDADLSAGVTKTIGPDGGEVKSADGKARLTIAKGTFASDTPVGLNPEKASNFQASLPANMKLCGDIWSASFQGAAKTLTLSLAVDRNQVLPQHLKKIGTYRYDTSRKQWNYIGGAADADGLRIDASLKEPGAYALILYDISFADTKGHWAQQAIEVLASHWYVNGMSDTQFMPDKVLTRAQFTKMLAGAIGLQPENPRSSTFSDVDGSHWGSGWIEAAYKAGMVQGFGTEFRPDDAVTREQMMTMLIRAMGQEAQAASLSAGELERAGAFPDAGKISEWAKPYVILAERQKLIEGDQQGIRPVDFSTRAEAAVVMLRLLSLQKKL